MTESEILPVVDKTEMAMVACGDAYAKLRSAVDLIQVGKSANGLQIVRETLDELAPKIVATATGSHDYVNKNNRSVLVLRLVPDRDISIRFVGLGIFGYKRMERRLFGPGKLIFEELKEQKLEPYIDTFDCSQFSIWIPERAIRRL